MYTDHTNMTNVVNVKKFSGSMRINVSITNFESRVMVTIITCVSMATIAKLAE